MNLTQILRSPVRAVVWTFDLCDPKGDPSLSKGMAFVFGVLIGRDVWLHGITGLNVGAMALVISAAFGRSVFMNWLTRFSMTANSNTQTNIDAAKVIEAIRARRDDAKGVEPTP